MPLKEFPATDVKGVLVSTLMGEIDLEFVDGETITVDYDADDHDDEKFICTIQDGVATLMPNIGRKNMLDLSIVAIDVRVQVPRRCHTVIHTEGSDIATKGTASSMEIETVKGDILVRGFDGKGKIKTESGDIGFHGDSEQLSLQTNSGDIETHLYGSGRGHLNIRSQSGRVEVVSECEAPENIVHIETIAGSIGAKGCFKTLHCTTKKGEVKLDGSFVSTMVSSAKGRIEGVGRFAVLDAKTDEGEIVFDLTMSNPSDLKLSCTSQSGDIRIKKPLSMEAPLENFTTQTMTGCLEI